MSFSDCTCGLCCQLLQVVPKPLRSIIVEFLFARALSLCEHSRHRSRHNNHIVKMTLNVSHPSLVLSVWQANPRANVHLVSLRVDFQVSVWDIAELFHLVRALIRGNQACWITNAGGTRRGTFDRGKMFFTGTETRIYQMCQSLLSLHTRCPISNTCHRIDTLLPAFF
jgi:hypothetical protein